MFKRIIIAIIVLIVVSGIVGGYVIWKAMQETVTPLRTLSSKPVGSKAIVIYSPGVSNFQEKISESFANGLVDSGWSVDIVTASSQAPTDLSSYDLLVIGGPIHGSLPSKPLQDYMERVFTLEGLRVYVLLSSLGGGPQGEQFMSDWINSKGGVEEGVLSLTTRTPNTPVDGSTDPAKIAEKTAQKISK